MLFRSVQCELKKIVFKVEQINISHPFVKGDRLRLRQIIINLLSNSFKFTSENGLIILTFKEITNEHNDISYCIEVHDSGIGMSEEYLHRLFKPFEQQNSETYINYGGSGLGLSITKKMLEHMNGSIDVHSKENEGTTFIINIKFEIVDDENLLQDFNCNKNDLPLPNYNEHFKGIHILIVEDHPLNMEIAKRIFESVSFIVDTAYTGEEAYKKYLSHEPYYYRFILMDIMMPIMNEIGRAHV